MANRKDNHFRTQKKLEIAMRQQRVIRKFMDGWSLREIAKEEGVSHITISGDIKKVLADLKEENKNIGLLFIDLELARMREALKAIYPEVLEGSLKHIEVMLKINERAGKILGNDQVEKIEQTVTYKFDMGESDEFDPGEDEGEVN